MRAWSSENRKGIPRWESPSVRVDRPGHPHPESPMLLRMAGYLAWHVRTAVALVKWRPDVIMSVEPHSALAVWIYYFILRGKARLFVHHHEYYAPEDFRRNGMRLLRVVGKMERRDLFQRAEWVSQTNRERMRLLREWNPQIRGETAKIFPNYPLGEWSENSDAVVKERLGMRPLRLIYVGSASFEDTFIREVVEWVGRREGEVSLHICGNNIHSDVWEWLRERAFANVTLEPEGRDYRELPSLLGKSDVGLVLYKGKTLNFVYNVPNKAIEYLSCGLEVWYPPEMDGMTIFHREHSESELRMIDFTNLPNGVPERAAEPDCRQWRDFTCEAAMEPLFAQMEETVRGNSKTSMGANRF